MIQFLHLLLHPLSPNGASLYGGILGDVQEIVILIAPFVWWRKHNCHVHGCPRVQWHAHPEHGHPVCKHHHPDGDSIS